MSAEVPVAGLPGSGPPPQGATPPQGAVPAPRRRWPRLRLPRPRLRPGPRGGRFVGRGIDIVLVAIIIALAATSAILIYGFVSSGFGQPAQLQPKPSSSLQLIPMGNAHIPTTNACVLCHAAGGEVKAPLPILHPIEGWRRCLTCHTNDALGRSAPGHEGIAETECRNCHKTGQAGPAITQPHIALANQRCLQCHGSVAHLPSTMASSKESDCVLCHKPTPLPPPSYPHAADVYLSCRTCHQSAEVGALPIDHARRSDETCLLCHEINVQGASAPVGPNPSLLLPKPSEASGSEASPIGSPGP